MKTENMEIIKIACIVLGIHGFSYTFKYINNFENNNKTIQNIEIQNNIIHIH